MTKYSKLLSNLYYKQDKPFGFSSVKKLFIEAKKHNSKITLKDVQRWFTTQDIPSRFSASKKKFKRPIFATSNFNHVWMGDLAFFITLSRYNEGKKYMLAICDMYSRRLISCIALRTKTAAETGKAFERVIKETNSKCSIFLTDKGGEFINPKLYKLYGIKHQVTEDPSQKVAILERVLHTIKVRLYRLMAREKSFRWIDKMEQVMAAYNDDPNRSLGGLTPNQAAQRKNKSLVFFNSVAFPETKRLSKSTPTFKYNVGDYVRISLKQNFGKSYLGNYSQVLYKISERLIKVGAVPAYKLEELLTSEKVRGVFYTEELKQVRLDSKTPLRTDIAKIHGFRMTDTNVEQVKISFKNNPKQQLWINYDELINYEK